MIVSKREAKALVAEAGRDAGVLGGVCGRYDCVGSDGEELSFGEDEWFDGQMNERR